MVGPERGRTSSFRSGRPGFMGLAVLGALLSTFVVGFVGDRLYDPREARAAIAEEVDQSVREELLGLGLVPAEGSLGEGAVDRLGRQVGVEVLVPTRRLDLALANGPVVMQPANDADSSAAAVLLARELSRYPRSFLAKSGLRRVVLGTALAEDEKAIPSLPNFQRCLLLDVAAPPEFLRRLIHHEVFHFADFADDGEVQRDPEWEAQNGPWFVYGPGGRFVRSPMASSPDGAPPGFVTAYATSALEEDKAETFSFMMHAPDLVAARAARDPVLAWKVRAIARKLQALAPEMDESFFSGRRGGPSSGR